MYVGEGMIDRTHGTKDQVRKVQKELKKLGYLGEKDVDGIFGKKTEDAVKKFQKDNKLVDDGSVGLRTGAMLNDKYAEALEKELEAFERALKGIEKALRAVEDALKSLRDAFGRGK